MITATDILSASILIVDDQEANVMVLEQMLRSSGYTEITTTRHPLTVGELHRTHRYDLILLDLQMPAMDGFQVMEGLKEIETGSYLPVIVITAQPDHKLRALKAGAKDFVSKPFDLAEVLLRVHNMLEVRLLHLKVATLNLARLENSQRLVGLGDWEYDPATRRLVWSEGIYRILGLTRKAFPPAAETLERLVHPDDLAAYRQAKTDAAHGSHRMEFQHRIIRPDGEVRHFQQITETRRDPQGRAVLESGTIQDITERKLAAGTLDESEKRHLQMLMLSPDAHFALLDGRLTFVNQSACTLLGAHLPAQLLGRPAGALVHPAQQELARAWSQLTSADQPKAPVEMKFVRLDGTFVEVEVVSVAFDFRGQIEVQVIARDITARQRAVTALRESEERFKFVARAVSDVVWDWNLPANTLWWNEGFLTTFGFAPGEIAPSVETRNNHIHPEDRGRVIESLQRAVSNCTEAWSAEYRFQRKDGSHAFVSDRGYILHDAAGKAVRMVGGMRDLTEQKKMEEQYVRAQRMESIGTLAGGIAHDLNNVLSPIMLSIDLLKHGLSDDPRRSKILDVIQVSTRRGADLVRQVLSFARGVDGRRVGIRLQRLIEDLEGIISGSFPRNIRIVTDVAPGLSPVMGDPSQLHQVLLNLAVNARDAMPEGGTLTLTATNIAVDAQFAATSQGSRVGTSQEVKAGPFVLLQVSDTGQGIAPEVLERIFEPFFTTKEIGKGTGIGLATVHTVVRTHHGFLNVESEVGQGTTFKVYLPADPSLRPVDTRQPFKADLPRGRGELVLVIDDEPSIREITRQTLESYGYHVISAGDGAEAVALYARQVAQVAVVLTDMMMPIMDGAATIQVLRRINPACRIIAASGIDSGKNVAKAASAGVSDFLPKPYAAKALLGLLREVLDRPA